MPLSVSDVGSASGCSRVYHIRRDSLTDVLPVLIKLHKMMDVLRNLNIYFGGAIRIVIFANNY